jgi:flavin reductase (DIM6/NTAB) family NADH-FMN oxidoreductase RutF
MKKKSLSLPRVYQLIEPGPVVMVSTSWRGKTNIMTMSWHMMVEFEPPMLACIISANNYTFSLLKASRECVINIPTVELADKVVRCGNMSGRKVDKFRALGLTPVKAAGVSAPLIAECYANLECKVVDTRMANRYNMFILEVVRAWIDRSVKQPRTMHHQGRGAFMIAGETIKLPSRMK